MSDNNNDLSINMFISGNVCKTVFLWKIFTENISRITVYDIRHFTVFTIWLLYAELDKKLFFEEPIAEMFLAELKKISPWKNHFKF